MSEINSINWYKGNILKEYCEPFQIAPHVYYVGPAFVGCYLFDTGEGLILLDQALAETIYLVFENIRKLGFDPADIKRLLISHGHFDHCGGTRLVQEYTKAEIFMSREDYRMMKERPIWTTYGYENWLPFEPDHFYDDENPIEMGRFKIHTRLTPGHTPGTTSFFFETTDEATGETFACALHGGIGLNTLNKEWFDDNPEWPKSLLDDYIASLTVLKDLTVDIAIPSHANQIPIFEKRHLIGKGPNPYVDRQAWPKLMNERLQRAIDNKKAMTSSN